MARPIARKVPKPESMRLNCLEESNFRSSVVITIKIRMNMSPEAPNNKDAKGPSFFIERFIKITSYIGYLSFKNFSLISELN